MSPPAPNYTELHKLREMTDHHADFATLSTFFTDLAEKKSAVYAFDVLKIAPFPPDTDMHLLGHAVGDILYKQLGVDGMRHCTRDFRNACSHSIVVGLFMKNGESSLPEIADACKKAPGGSGAYLMCYHGLGHGILAAVGYDLKKSISICQKTVGGSHQGELSECVGGGVMEIIGGGFHDKSAWERERPKYLSPTNPLSLCHQPYMPEVSSGSCYSYLTPYLIEAVGGNMNNLEDETIVRAFRLCETIPASQAENRKVCFGGFGKEFTVLAKKRDIRNLEQMTGEELATAYTWCKLAPHEEARLACIAHALNSLFWGGENDPNVSVRFCESLDRSVDRPFCFDRIFELRDMYLQNPQKRHRLCKLLPADQRSRCRT